MYTFNVHTWLQMMLVHEDDEEGKIKEDMLAVR